MAVGVYTDFQIYDDFFHSGRTEVLMQNTDVFNENSGGAIRLIDQARQGHFAYESFYEEITGLDVRRDISNGGTLTPDPLTQDEFISVKLNRRQGPRSQTLDAFKKQGMGTMEGMQKFSMVLGQQSAKAQMQRYVNSVASALVAAISGVGSSDLVVDATDGTLQYSDIVSGLARAGDNAGNIVTILTHSAPFFSLHSDSLATYKIENVAGMLIVDGGVGTMGRRVVVTDSPALFTVSGSTTTYHTLLLYQGAAKVEESEDDTVFSDQTGGHNVKLEWQYEYAYNLGVKGFKWNTSAGGINPDDTALALSSNWVKAATDNKSLAGVMINSVGG